MKTPDWFLFCSLLLLSVQLEAKTYSMCAQSYGEAKLELASMINSTVSNVQSKKVQSKRNNETESVTSTIEQINSVESHLDLVEINLFKKGGEQCAKVEHEQQVGHTKVLLEKTKTFTVTNLPKNAEKKVLLLEKWLEVIASTQQMINVFGDGVSEREKLELSIQYKKFSDIHTETLLQIDALVFKGCGESRTKALESLDQEIFTHNKYEEKGFFSSMASWVSGSEETLKVMLFEPYISYRKIKKHECAYIVKSELLHVTETMQQRLDGFKIAILPTEPKKRLDRIDNWLTHVNVTYDLMQVYSGKFKDGKIQNAERLKVALTQERKSIIPQSIMFRVLGAANPNIVVNSKSVKENTKNYLPKGIYNYSVSAEGFCPVKGSIELDALEDKIVDVDFAGQMYPTVLFVSDIDFTAMVDGVAIQPNIRKTIPRCSQKVQYLVKANGQSYHDSLDLDPGDNITKNFSFLDQQERAVFADVKTKYFSVKNDEKISDTLTSYSSKKLSFTVTSSPKNGTLKLEESGHFVYTPDPEFVGKVSFDYVVDNGNEKSSQKVAIIQVTGTVRPAAPEAEKKQEIAKEEVKEPLEEVKKTASEDEEATVLSKQAAQERTEPAKVDEAKLESFLNDRLKANDITTLKEAQKRFPEAFDKWMKKVRGL